MAVIRRIRRVRPFVRQRRYCAHMNDLVPSVGESHEPLLEVGDLFGDLLSVLPVGPGVNRRLDWRPDERLAVARTRVGNGLKESPKGAGALVALGGPSQRLKRRLEKNDALGKVERRCVPPRLGEPPNRDLETVRRPARAGSLS